jgi:hypothetical protein
MDKPVVAVNALTNKCVGLLNVVSHNRDLLAADKYYWPFEERIQNPNYYVLHYSRFRGRIGLLKHFPGFTLLSFW